jgi:hypothetical protein
MDCMHGSTGGRAKVCINNIVFEAPNLFPLGMLLLCCKLFLEMFMPVSDFL